MSPRGSQSRDERKLPSVTIYTDGACRPNPGPGGWAAIILRRGSRPQQLCGSDPASSNNRMELQAALAALRALEEPHAVVLYTDSEYLCNGITLWLERWERGGWKTVDREPVKNQELWRALAQEIRQHRVDWQWVKGHSGQKWNRRADELARRMARHQKLPLDDESALHIFASGRQSDAGRNAAWAVLLRYRAATKLISGVDPGGSAKRAALLAALNGLQAVKRRLPIHLYTDCEYVRDGATRWMRRWAERGWRTADDRPVAFRQLWQALAELTARYDVKWHLVERRRASREMARARAEAKALLGAGVGAEGEGGSGAGA